MSNAHIAAIIVGLNIFLLACGGTSPTGTAEALLTSTPVQVEEMKEGQALFVAKGCAACHGQNAEGSPIAPALPGHTEEMVERQVRNPRFQMPAFSETQVSDEELEAIAHYIANLSGEDHAHPQAIEVTAAVEMHHWMALEALKANDPPEATHHVNHIVELLEPGDHRRRMVEILESLQAGRTFDAEHEIEEMLARFASPRLSPFQLHLRQALASLAVEDAADAQHHIVHAQELSDPADKASVNEVLELMERGEHHQAEHEIQKLLGLEDHRD